MSTRSVSIVRSRYRFVATWLMCLGLLETGVFMLAAQKVHAAQGMCLDIDAQDECMREVGALFWPIIAVGSICALSAVAFIMSVDPRRIAVRLFDRELDQINCAAFLRKVTALSIIVLGVSVLILALILA